MSIAVHALALHQAPLGAACLFDGSWREGRSAHILTTQNL
jgi:hypothetical protein